MTINLPSCLSWSALSSYAECGERFRLERGFKIKGHTWFATVAGSAIHEITEHIDLAIIMGMTPMEALELAPDFRGKFDQLLAEEEVEVWPSGRILTEVGEQGGPQKRDYDWWLIYGPEYVARYARWRDVNHWEIAVLPNGSYGIEVEVTIELDGIQVKGYVDRIFYDPQTGDSIIVDLKTGKEPKTKLQLKTYHVAVKSTHGLDCKWATIWSPSLGRGKKFGSPEAIGNLQDLIDTAKWKDEQVEFMYSSALRGIRAGVFIPQVTQLCNGCVVSEWCWAVAGDKRREVPISQNITDPVSGELVFTYPTV